MHSSEIQEFIYNWAMEQNFTAPYGVLTGSHTNKKGRKYLSVTFGRARTLDASVNIYNRNFIVLQTSRKEHDGVYNSLDSLMESLRKL